VRPTVIVVFDAVKDSITVVTPVRAEAAVDAKTALARAVERLASVVESLDRPLDKSLTGYDAGPLDVPPKSNTTPAQYKAMVLKAKDYIVAGDAFQIVLAQRRLRCRRFRSIARCGGPIPRLISISSTSVASLLPAQVPKSWSKSAATASPSGRSPGRVRVAIHLMKIKHWKTNCWPIRRSAPSI
jgi:hypothetical protein